MLQWRRDANVDKIRNNILYGGMDHPTKFPYADIIMKHAYQIVIAIDALDNNGNPVSLETFNFEPKDVMKIITTDQYLEFLAYTLEYKALIVEQLSEEREKRFLASYDNNPPYTPEGYGVIVKVNIIRDLDGFGRRHMTADAKKVLGEGLKIGVNHYNEFMARGIMTNTPFLFSALWLFVKMFLDAKTIAKIRMLPSDYMPQLLEEIPLESIPERLGGSYKGDNEYIKLQTEVGGVYYRPETDRDNISEEKPDDSDDSFYEYSTKSYTPLELDDDAKALIRRHRRSNHCRPRSMQVHNEKNDDKVFQNDEVIPATAAIPTATTRQQSTWVSNVLKFLRSQGFALIGVVIFSVLFLHFDSDIPKLLVLPFLLYFMVEVLVW